MALLRSIAPTVANLVFEEMHRAELVTTGRRWNLISELLAAIGDSSDLEKVLNLAAKTMCNELRCSLVRISTYDVDGSNLKSRALAVHPGLEVERPAAAVMPLAALPYHRLIRDTGRMMLVNQESTVRRMCPDEQREVFVTGLGSALLVPIRAGHRVLGVVSLADVREWRHYRFEQADMSLVMSVASGLAPALRSALCIRSVTGLAGAGPIPRVESHRNDPASRRTGAGRQLAGAGELVPRT